MVKNKDFNGIDVTKFMYTWQAPMRQPSNVLTSYQKMQTQHSQRTSKRKEVWLGGQPPINYKW